MAGLFDDLIPAAGDTGGGPTRLTVTPAGTSSIDPKARELAIRTVLGEAANEPDEGQRAVAAVIQNRVKAGRYGGDSIPRVVTAKNQFEPWNTEEGRSRMYSYAPDSDAYKRAAANVDAIFNGVDPDPTNGATHFVAPQAQAALGRQMPSWAQGEGQPIGRHTFFAPEGRVQTASAAPVQSAPLPTVGAPAAPAGGLFDDLVPSGGGQFMAPPADGQNLRVMREGVSEPAPRQIGVAEAAGRGAARGVTANFYDELRGLMEAGGLNPNDPASLGSLVQGAYKYWSGDPNAAKAYDTATARERATDKRAQAEQPAASLGGELAGAVALPIGGALSGATTAARVGRSAAVGAGYGAAAGAGEGTDAASRATQAATGGLVGGAVGAAAVPALAAVEAGGRAIGRVAEPAMNALRGQSGVEREAAKRATGAISRDLEQEGVETASARLRQIDEARRNGAPVVNADLGGEATRDLVRSATNTSGEASAAVKALADSRFEGQSDRASQFLKSLTGAGETKVTKEALQDAARKANRPAYAKAYNSPQAASMWDEGLQQLMQAPVVQDAAKAAARTGANRAAAEGFTPVRNPFKFEGDQFTLAGEAKPSLQFWDAVKQNLDDRISAFQRSGENGAARDAINLKNALVNHLDDLVPAYKSARAGAAGFFGAQDALEAGQKFLSSNMTAAEGARGLAKMGDAERDLFRQSFAAGLIEKINGTRDRVNVLNQIGQSPKARDKLKVALGPEGYQRVEAFLTTESVMDRLRGALSNSTTARQLYNLGIAGGVGYGGFNYNDPTSMAQGALVALLSGRGKKIDERIARRVAEMLMSSDPNVLAKGVKAAAANQNLVRAFRDIDKSLARIGGTQGNAVPALQLPGTGRADDQQPAVPGPIGQ